MSFDTSVRYPAKHIDLENYFLSKVLGIQHAFKHTTLQLQLIHKSKIFKTVNNGKQGV